MTLKSLLDSLSKVAYTIPNVNTVILGDVYQLNKLTDVDYSVICIYENNATINNNSITHTVTIFYIDRLVDNGENEYSVKSTGEVILKEILTKLDVLGEIEIDSNKRLNYFTQKFADECAGVYMQVDITSDMGDDCIMC